MAFKHLEAFVYVVEKNSFSKAAEALFLTQPTISAHIATLEKTLNTTLIQRSTKNLHISTEGKQLYTYAKEILALRNEILAHFQVSCLIKNITHLTIGVSTNPAQYILPELLAAYQNYKPNSRFATVIGDSSTVLQKVKEKSVDLGIVGTKIQDPKLIFEKIYEEELVLIMPNKPEYQRMLKKKDIFYTMTHAPIILREGGSGTRMEFEKYLNRKNIRIETLNMIAEISNPESIRESVVQGLGIAVMSQKSIENLVRLNKVLAQPLTNPPLKRHIYIAYTKEKNLPKYVRAFIQFATNYYSHNQLEPNSFI